MSMDVKDLEEYLRIVVDLEKNIYLQKQLMEKLQKKIFSLGKPRKYVKPIQPKEPNELWEKSEVLFKKFYAFAIATLLSGLLGIAFFVFRTSLWIIIITSISFVILLLITTSLYEKYKNEKTNYDCELERYQKAITHYNYEFGEYQNALAQDKKRLIIESHQQKMLQKNLRELEDRNRTTTQTLANIYSLNIVFEKYRSLPKVCTLYEYICSRRCTTLGSTQKGGNDGAYTLLEEEERDKKIILLLEEILVQLNAIRENQYMLYQVIQEGNQTLNTILSRLDQVSVQMDQILSQNDYVRGEYAQRLVKLEGFSAITAYNTARIEKELSYMNRMNYFAGKYDAAGIFRRIPPV